MHGVENPCDGCIGCGRVLTEVKNASHEGLDGAKEGVATAGEADDLTANSILLRSEGEGSETSLTNLLERRRLKVDTGRSNKKLNVLQTKRVSVVVSIFARAEEEEKGQDNHIRGRAENRKRAVRGLGDHRDSFDDRDRNGFYAERRGVRCLPGL